MKEPFVKQFEKYYWNHCNDSDSMWIHLINKGKASKELSVTYADSCVYHMQFVMSRDIDYRGKTEEIIALEKAEYYAKRAVALLEECKTSEFALKALETSYACAQAVHYFNMSLDKTIDRTNCDSISNNPEYKYQANILRSLVPNPFSH